MARRVYYTLCVNDGTKSEPLWGPQFGDYDRECVEEELVRK